MKAVARNTWLMLCEYNFEDFIRNTSRFAGVASFVLTLAGIGYLATTL